MVSKKKFSLALMGSRPLSIKVLEHLNKQDYIDIKGVVPIQNKNRYWNGTLEEKAQNLGVPCLHENELLSEPIDLILSVHYDKIIKEPILSHPKIGIVNIHYSYNLKYRGRNCTTFAILNARKNNEWFHGTTLHFIDEKIDRGKIIDSYKCGITEEDTAKSLYERVDNLSFELIKNALPKIFSGNYQLKDPDENSIYHDVNSMANKEVDMNMSSEEIYDFIRAFTFPPFEKPYMVLGNKKIYLSIDDKNEKKY